MPLNVLHEVGSEMSRQLSKWGQQNHPSYTMGGALRTNIKLIDVDGDLFKYHCDTKADNGTISWLDILLEEMFEAVDEAKKGDLKALRMELVQVAAVACSFIESIDRNGK